VIPDRTLAHLGSLADADLELVVELIDLIATRPRLRPEMPDRYRHDKARGHMAAGLDFARRVCGDGVVREAYGAAVGEREKALEAFAERADLASFAFGSVDQGPGSLNEAAAEARAIAQGDKPQAFAKLGRRRAVVLLRTKFEALRWDAWLTGIGMGVEERHTAIADAFGSTWDTISRWRPDVESAWGRDALQQIDHDRLDASRGLRMWSMAPNEAWPIALTKSGERYLAALRDR
jgi:hypothetical protein